jgi:predicted enzyme related to lactoylglutathione lyase
MSTAPAIKTVIHPVKDLGAAKAVFGALVGVEPVMDELYYVGFQLGEMHVGLDPNGHAKGMTGPLAYWHVDDIQGTVDTLLSAGATATEKPHDVGGGRLVATLADTDGNPIGLIQE